MRERIRARLQDLETREAVRILYACESGSRAWGFASTDSDYDVRFIYLHPTDWYLSIDQERKRDVIECPIDGRLDIVGWDLRKALQLLRKFNPPLMEWLGSPIVYSEAFTIASRMRDLLAKHYSPVACLYHYLHMAQGNYRDYVEGPTVWLKKYFYVLRPLLAIKWIERDLGVVPTEFEVLVAQVVDDPRLREEIGKLTEIKRRGEELDRGPRIAPLSDYIESELARLAGKPFERDYAKLVAPLGEFDELFRSALDEVWSQ